MIIYIYSSLLCMGSLTMTYAARAQSGAPHLPPAALPAMGTSPTSHSSYQHLITIAGRKRGTLSSQNCRKELGNVTLAFSSQETELHSFSGWTGPDCPLEFVAFCLGITYFPERWIFFFPRLVSIQYCVYLEYKIKISVWLDRWALAWGKPLGCICLSVMQRCPEETDTFSKKGSKCV